METIQMTQGDAGMGTCDWQLHQDSAPSHAPRLRHSFLVKHQITPATQPPYSSNMVPCGFWLFPKLQWPLKGKRFQTTDKIQENMMGQLVVIGRRVWGPKVPTLKGPGHHYPVYTVSCILYILQWISVISSYMAGYLLGRPCIPRNWSPWCIKKSFIKKPHQISMKISIAFSSLFN